MIRAGGAFLAIALAILGACKTAPVRPPGVLPPAQVSAVPPDANFALAASEAVATAEDDQNAYVRIFVDGKESGQTPVDAKSKPKKWGAVLSAGNHLFRFEEWVLAPSGAWAPLREDWQPPERFIRVEPGAQTFVALKFYDGGRQHTLDVFRAPLGNQP